MDLSCKIIEMLPETVIKGRNGDFIRGGFVAETIGQYPKKVKFDVLGDLWGKIKQSYVVGSSVQVYFDVESRLWKLNWYTTLRVWRVDDLQKAGAGNNSQSQQQPQAANNNNNGATDNSDSVPF